MSEWIDIRIQENSNRLLFRYNPSEDIVQIAIRKQVYEVCLSEYRADTQDNLASSLTFDAEGDRI